MFPLASTLPHNLSLSLLMNLHICHICSKICSHSKSFPVHLESKQITLQLLTACPILNPLQTNLKEKNRTICLKIFKVSKILLPCPPLLHFNKGSLSFLLRETTSILQSLNYKSTSIKPVIFITKNPKAR